MHVCMYHVISSLMLVVYLSLQTCFDDHKCIGGWLRAFIVKVLDNPACYNAYYFMADNYVTMIALHYTVLHWNVLI